MYIAGHCLTLAAHPVDATLLVVHIDGHPLLTVRRARPDELSKFHCPCSYHVNHRDGLLKHAYAHHYTPPRPAWSSERCQPEYKLAGVHPDPTYETAVVHLTGSRS